MAQEYAVLAISLTKFFIRAFGVVKYSKTMI